MKDIILEAEQLLMSGKYREITLLGQNVNSYGNDLNDGSNFKVLIDKLTDLNYDFRLKFMTSHPKDLSDEVIELIARKERMSKFIHLPVQSGSTAVLKAMNRKYTREDYLRLITKIKNAIPDAGLSSDVMVGFPGETEQDFLDTLSLIEEVKFDNLYMFVYSKRSGTAAEKMPNK
ncbi:cdk5 regulatory subunit-associated protein 1 [Holotrichia oblita]|nr:cdk5 regulatory subunit-associated protein 1 [Holotrichia oblita]